MTCRDVEEMNEHHLLCNRHDLAVGDKKCNCQSIKEWEEMNKPIGLEVENTQCWRFDFIDHISAQKAWSYSTFGTPAERGSDGVIDHLKKEIHEVEQNPRDLEEWIDIIMLAIDGASREGHSPEEIAIALSNKLERNKCREWPDWRNAEPGKAIEHVKTT